MEEVGQETAGNRCGNQSYSLGGGQERALAREGEEGEGDETEAGLGVWGLMGLPKDGEANRNK